MQLHLSPQEPRMTSQRPTPPAPALASFCPVSGSSTHRADHIGPESFLTRPDSDAAASPDIPISQTRRLRSSIPKVSHLWQKCGFPQRAQGLVARVHNAQSGEGWGQSSRNNERPIMTKVFLPWPHFHPEPMADKKVTSVRPSIMSAARLRKYSVNSGWSPG